MPTPSGLVTKTELIDAQLDTAHLGRVVNSKDAAGNPISQSTNRTGGVNATLNALLAKIGLYSVGFWTDDPTLTEVNQYVRDNSTGLDYQPVTLPYAVDSALNPDPETLVTSGVLKRVNEVTQQDLIDQLGLLVGGSVYPGDDGAYVKNGDTVPSGTTHLIVQIGGIKTLVAMSPVASGAVSSITDISADIGATLVKFKYWDTDTVNQPSASYYQNTTQFLSAGNERQTSSVTVSASLDDLKDTLVTGTEIVQQTSKQSFVTYNSTGLDGSENNAITDNKVSQPQQDSASNNNHALFKFRAANYGKVIGNTGLCDIFTTQGYGFGPAGTSASAGSKYGMVLMNSVGVSGMFDEILGGEKGLHGLNIAVGGKANGDRTRSHAYRLSGYDGARAIHNLHFDSFISGFNTGFSYQKTARYNHASGNVVHDVNEVIQATTSTDEEGGNLASYPQRNNRNHGVAHKVGYVANLLGMSHSSIDYVADDIESDALYAVSDPNGLNASTHNEYKGIYSNVVGDGLFLNSEANYSRIDLTFDVLGGRPFNIASNYNAGRIVATGFSSRGFLSGSNNILSLVLRDGVVTTTAIQITGDDNIITIDTNMDVVVSGNGNKFIGSIGGVITNTGDNDFSDVKEFVDRGKFNGTTDVDGYVDIPHKVNNYNAALCNKHGSDGSYAQVFATNDSSLRVRCFDASGTPLSSTAVTISWRVETGYANLP